MQQPIYNSHLFVNIRDIQQNFIHIQKDLGPAVEIIPVLKCNAYGIGAVPVANALLATGSVKTIAVAQVQEAIVLRNSGILSSNILVLGGAPNSVIPLAIQHNIQLTVHNLSILKTICNEVKIQNKNTYSVQIKIETGLNRVGIKPGKELEEIAQFLKSNPTIHVAGAFTHFIDGENENSLLAKDQTDIYKKALEQLASCGIPVPMKHICASAATEWCGSGSFNTVRVGRRLFMDAPCLEGAPSPTGHIKEVCSWRSSIVAVRNVKKGEKIGYGGHYIAQTDMKIAIACVGYGDGLLPELARQKAPVLIDGKPAQLIVTAMDQCFIDVTEVACSIGSEITFFGYASTGEFLSSQKIAAYIHDEGVFLTTFLSERVERVYI